MRPILLSLAVMGMLLAAAAASGSSESLDKRCSQGGRYTRAVGRPLLPGMWHNWRGQAGMPTSQPSSTVYTDLYAIWVGQLPYLCTFCRQATMLTTSGDAGTCLPRSPSRPRRQRQSRQKRPRPPRAAKIPLLQLHLLAPSQCPALPRNPALPRCPARRPTQATALLCLVRLKADQHNPCAGLAYMQGGGASPFACLRCW